MGLNVNGRREEGELMIRCNEVRLSPVGLSVNGGGTGELIVRCNGVWFSAVGLSVHGGGIGCAVSPP